MAFEYQALRTFVDSWGLVAMAIFFVTASAFAFRPSARHAHDEAAQIPFKED
ncbi:MAG: cbb3-type cytochrome c oxidase subunit 3 [Hyphomicrobiales bacterium]